MSAKSRLTPLIGLTVFFVIGVAGGVFASWLIELIGDIGLSVSLVTLAIMYIVLTYATQKKPGLMNLIYFTLMGLGTTAMALMLCDALGLVNALVQTCIWLGLFFIVLLGLSIRKPDQVKPY